MPRKSKRKNHKIVQVIAIGAQHYVFRSGSLLGGPSWIYDDGAAIHYNKRYDCFFLHKLTEEKGVFRMCSSVALADWPRGYEEPTVSILKSL